MFKISGVMSHSHLLKGSLGPYMRKCVKIMVVIKFSFSTSLNFWNMVVSVFYFQCFLMKTNVILGINQVASCSLTLHNPSKSLEPYCGKLRIKLKTLQICFDLSNYYNYYYYYFPIKFEPIRESLF